MPELSSFFANYNRFSELIPSVKAKQSKVTDRNDYYPGGMLMPERSYSQSTSKYRYGFNGKENDNEVKGEGNQQDYGMRIYDPRLVRFLSVDPITKKYPELTPYQFASNTPICGIDLDGMEVFYAADGSLLGKIGKDITIKVLDTKFVQNLTTSLAAQKMTVTQAFKNINAGTAKDVKGSMKYLNDHSKETYTTMDNAAADFGLMNGSLSICTNQEFAARIGYVQLKGTNKTVYILGSTIPGDESGASIDNSDLYGAKLAGGAHTHGADPRIPGVHANNFSGKAFFESLGQAGDMDWANHNGTPLYLANPAGQLKVFAPKYPYEPGDENGKLIRSDMPFDIHGSGGDHNTPRPAYNYGKIDYEENRRPNASDAIPYKLPK